jgi:hypothetical protein
MDSRDIAVYLKEAETQCRLAIGAVIALNNALNANSDAPGGGTDWERFKYIQGEIFRSLHSLLTHASNISRLFWPPTSSKKEGQAREQRGSFLRSRVGLAEDGHVLKKRTLRDHLEHFDERIDHWRETSVRKNYAQDIVAPKGAIYGLEETDIMRWYDPSRKMFMFRGEEFDIQELISAIDALRPLISAAVQKAEQELRDGRS